MSARLGLFIPLVLSTIFVSQAYAARIVVSCGSVGKELEVCRSGALRWARQSGNEVHVLAAPSASGERLAQYQLLLAAKAPDIDVFLIDTTWPAMLADFLLDLNQDEQIRDRKSDYFPSFIKNNTIRKRLVALPWFIDAGLLYYRKDLLEKYREKPPTTWPELGRIAKRIQEGERRKGRERFWGYVFQGRAYEGLTCNALEWIRGAGGGTIVDESGKITIDNPIAAKMFGLIASWIGEISPAGVLNYMEEETRGVFQSGNAAMMRNWPYAWKLANSKDSPVRGKVGIMPLPGGKSALGGWSLAVSKYSKNPTIAISLVRFLASPEEQKMRTLLLGQSPTVPALYRDDELLRENPALPLFFRIFQEAFSRPSRATGASYNRVSAEFWDSVHRILSAKGSPEENLKSLKQRLLWISRGEKW